MSTSFSYKRPSQRPTSVIEHADQSPHGAVRFSLSAGLRRLNSNVSFDTGCRGGTLSEVCVNFPDTIHKQLVEDRYGSMERTVASGRARVRKRNCIGVVKRVIRLT